MRAIEGVSAAMTYHATRPPLRRRSLLESCSARSTR